MAGGALWSVKAILDVAAGPGLVGIADVLFFVVPLLLAAGVAGLYVRYAGRMRGAANAGFVQALTGLALLAGGFAAGSIVGMEGAEQISSFGFLILALGLVLIGFDALKFGALPRWNFLPLAMGVLVPLAAIAGDFAPLRVALAVAFGLCWTLLGFLLWSDAGEETGA